MTKAATRMNDVDPERFKEHNVDHRALEIAGLERRIRAECERRIEAAYPIARQVQMLAAHAIYHDKTLSTDERAFAETDALALKCFVRAVTRHRLAADLLVRSVNSPGADLKAINPAADSWWKYDD